MSLPLDSDLFLRTVRAIAGASGSKVAPGSEDFVLWLVSKKVPQELIDLFSREVSEGEIWAGAGTLFGESSIMRWNDDFPEAIQQSLLIIGSAPNGDHICTDLISGDVGYICHEKEWRLNPRGCFVSVSKTMGTFIRDINDESSGIPEDYWEAQH